MYFFEFAFELFRAKTGSKIRQEKVLKLKQC